MHCPACKNTTARPPELQPAELERGLPVMSCTDCAGVLLDHQKYSEWANSGGAEDWGVLSGITVRASSEKAGAKFCPNCSSYLVKYDVASGAEFTIDRCGRCGQIWLDGNEWELLKSRSLHKNVLQIFSTNWQSQIIDDQHGKALAQIWKEQFGADYDELMRIKNWIDGHQRAPEMYAFLFSERNHKRN